MDQPDIELDALRALAGAELIQRSTLAGLALGNPSIDSLAYAIKCRVKAHEKLVLKVLERRRKGKHTYRAQDATDIVGLRLLTLFRNELPELLRQFLDFLEWAQREPFNLFVGPNLDSTINEIIIYRTTAMADVTDDLIAREFERIGFPPVTVEPGTDPVLVKAKAKIVHNPNEYSSIHIVAWASSKRTPRKVRIPIEIQIRTALEDVWGEIDHRLKYKTKNGDPKLLNEDGRRQYELAKESVSILKRQLDACGLTADNIFNHMQELFTRSSYQVKPTRAAVASVDIDSLLHLHVDARVKALISNTVPLVRTAYIAASVNTSGYAATDWINAVDTLQRAADALKACMEEYSSGTYDAETDRYSNYYLRMEYALCLFWIARISRLHLSGNVDPTAPTLREDHLELALKEYLSLQKDKRFSRDPVLAFRLAHALSLRGDESFALEMYREAVANLGDDDFLPQDHYMRVRIPRFLGIVLWDMAEDIRRAGAMSGNVGVLGERRRRYYLDAIDVTRDVVDRPIAAWTDLDGERGDPELESALSKNNILEFAICFLKANGTWDELGEHNVTRPMMQDYLNVLIANGIDGIELPTIADTVRAVASYLGKTKLAKKAAKKVKALMKSTGVSSALPKEAIREMLDDASAELRSKHKPRRPITRTSKKPKKPS